MQVLCKLLNHFNFNSGVFQITNIKKDLGFIVLLFIALQTQAQQKHLLTIHFQSGETQPGENEIRFIENFCDSLLKIPDGFRLEVIGHADNSGDSLLNIRISEQRAESVARYLQEGGLAPKQITIGVFGENAPLSKNRGNQNKFNNRRVEIILSPIAQIEKTSADKILAAQNDTLLVFPNGTMLLCRMKNERLAEKSDPGSGLVIFGNGNYHSTAYLCSPSFKTDRSRPLSLYAWVEFTNLPDSVHIYSVYIPYAKQISGLEVFLPESNDDGAIWKSTRQSPESITHQGKKYYRFEYANSKIYALGKEMPGFGNSANAVLLSSKTEMDSVYLIYNRDTLQTRFDYKADGNMNSPNQYSLNAFYPELEPEIIVFLNRNNQVYTLSLFLSDLKKQRGGRVYRIPKKMFRKKQTLKSCIKNKV